MVSKKTGILLLIGLALTIIIVGFLLNPIPQMQSYHHFADQRTIFDIEHAWNVLSNIPFALAGIWGLLLLCPSEKIKFIDRRQRWPWIGVCIGLILTAIGSSYYHLATDNSRLVWDRLAMTIVFTSYVAALISERLSPRFGLWLWPILVGIGFSSVFAWVTSESYGESDLRFYLGVQVFSLLAPLILLLTPSPYTHSRVIVVVAFFYVLAVIFEKVDYQIYQLSGGLINGHTLKHLTAAFAAAWLIRMIWKRKIILEEK